MSTANTRCPKCNNEMVQGFIVDFGQGPGRLVSSWVEGPPEKSFWGRTKVPTDKSVPVATFRCFGCGFLESYVQPEFAAK